MPASALPSWIAVPVARATAPDAPTSDEVRDVLASFVEFAVLRMLADALRDAAHLPFPVESAMRLAMAEPMELDAWLDVYAALVHAGHDEPLGLAEELAPDHPLRAAAAVLGLDRVDLLAVLQEASDLDGIPEPARAPLVQGIARVAAESGLPSIPLVLVRDLRPGEGGLEVERVELVGTVLPSGRRSVHDDGQGLAPGGLAFWDGGGGAVPVPSWLAWWDDRAGALRLFGGRERTGAWRYPTRTSLAPVAHRDSAPSDAPPFLAEPTWSTPAPSGRSELAQTAMFVRGEEARATVEMALTRRAVPPLPRHEEDRGQLVLRVIAGRELMRFAPLHAGTDVIIGRNPSFATFVVHHREVSRSHTRVLVTSEGQVRVEDLRSTNGTLVNGRPVGREGLVVKAGDVVSAGPILLRVERLGPERMVRLERMQALREDPSRRDPLTTLLQPRHLVDELPVEARPDFREGGEAAAPMWGLLLYVDRLAAIHAQHGQKAADTVFQNASRLVQYALPHPERAVRVGYGEILVPLPEADEAGARALAASLLEVLEGHVWEVPVSGVTLTAALARRQQEESAQAWLQRLRRTLQEGRTRQGRGDIYLAGS